MQHANIEEIVEAEQQRFNTWPDKMAKLEAFAREAAETLVQVEREHQDQVCLLCMYILSLCLGLRGGVALVALGIATAIKQKNQQICVVWLEAWNEL